jgi:hypothetical protein
MSPQERFLILLLVLRETASVFMLVFVLLEAYKRTRHLLHRIRHLHQADWRQRLRLYAAAGWNIVIIIGGPVLFTLFHIADMNEITL